MNFKKQIAILVALFVLLANSGTNLVLHFCHDEVAFVSLVYQENALVKSSSIDSCCGGEEILVSTDDEDSGCCSNKEIKVEKKVDYSVAKHLELKFEAIVLNTLVVDCTTIALVNKKLDSVIKYYCDSNAPPLYKLYSQYIYYA